MSLVRGIPICSVDRIACWVRSSINLSLNGPTCWRWKEKGTRMNLPGKRENTLRQELYMLLVSWIFSRQIHSGSLSFSPSTSAINVSGVYISNYFPSTEMCEKWQAACRMVKRFSRWRTEKWLWRLLCATGDPNSQSFKTPGWISPIATYPKPVGYRWPIFLVCWQKVNFVWLQIANRTVVLS